MLRAVVYMRKSSEDSREDKQKYSKERQENDIKTFIGKHNETCNPEERFVFINGEADYFFDDVSWKKTDRDWFIAMTKRIKDGRYDVLICTDLSRLARNPIDSGMLANFLEETKRGEPRKLSYVYTADSKRFDASINTDRFTFSMFLAIAKYENDNRWSSTKSGSERKRGAWWTANIAPFWYINDEGEKGERIVVPDTINDLFRKLKTYWELFATGNYTRAQIAQIGKDEGLTKSSGAVPSDNIYGSMFRNRYYTGKVKTGTNEDGTEKWIEWKHEAMVSDELFEKVQQILARTWYSHEKPLANPTYDNLLRDLLVCGKSKQKMFLDVKIRYTCDKCNTRSSASVCPKCETERSQKVEEKAEIRRYYVCPKWFAHIYAGSSVPMRNIKAEYIEGIIDSELSKISISDSLFDVLRKRMYTLWLEENGNMEKEKKTIRKRISMTEEEKILIRKNVLLDKSSKLSQDGTIMDVAANEIEERDIKIAEYQERLRKLEGDLDDKFEKAWEILNVMLEMKKVFWNKDKISLEPKRNLLISVCSNQIFTDGKIEIIWKKPFDILIKQDLTKKKSPIKWEISSLDVEWLPQSKKD